MRLVDVLIAAADEQQRSVPTLRSVANSQPAAEAASTSGAVPALVVDTAHSSPQYSPRGAYTRSSQSQLRIIARRDSSPNSASPTPSNRQKAAPPSNATAMAVVPVVDEVIATVDAETAAKVDKAFELTARANKLISQGLHNCSEWNEVRDLYFNAAAHFQGAGYHFEAGEAFNNAAAISRVYGSQLEVATAASYAVDSFKVADPMQAIALLKETLQIHRDDGRTNLEAKAAKDIAEMYENLGEKSEALNFYRHACALYERQEMTRNFYLKTLDKCARLSADLMAYRDAIASFEKLAQSATKGTRVTDRYTFALLCWLADASGERQAAIIAKANSTFDKYQDIDQYLQKGVEHDLIKGFLAAWDKGSLATFDAAHKRYVEYRGAEEWVERQIAQIRSNLFQYVLPYM